MSLNATFQWKGDCEQQLKAQLEGLSAAASGAALGQAVLKGAMFLNRQVQINISNLHLIDTSNYINSWRARPGVTEAHYATAIMGTPVVYGPIHEYGGVIKAKNKPFLVFKTKDGKWHSVKSVVMPARPHLRPAFDEHVPEVEEIIATQLRTGIEAALARRAAPSGMAAGGGE
jgi:hypothetical protein